MTELSESVRQQFDRSPYPRYAIEDSPRNDLGLLYQQSIVNSFYKRDGKVIDTKNLTVLDAGCGSGYKALALAVANPGISVVGVDFSKTSVELARHRLKYHNIENAEFHAVPLEDIGNLGIEFDYINCDEVLYLLPDPVAGLQALTSVLKPHGIIRGNFHSQFQRVRYFRAQKLFQMMGLMEEDVSDDMAIALVRDTMNALKDSIDLKQAWSMVKDDEERLLANYLLREDRGYTIPQLFDILDRVGLEFISMTNWRQWDVMDLFENPEDLPAFLGISLPETSISERLHLYELIHPIHRLLDFWCGYPDAGQTTVPISERTPEQWKSTRVYLHPLLRLTPLKADMTASAASFRGLVLNRYLPIPGASSFVLDTTSVTLLLPLFERDRSFTELVAWWQAIYPVDLVTRQPITEKQAWGVVCSILTTLEHFGSVMLELTPSTT
ncbi:3-demethylubiquinone-9 3-methyltransferase [Geitlerinema sp. FC II]|nr:3-demethylubiquinone-9 3-methyltransferase [Geitlerinema sp. FC II]